MDPDLWEICHLYRVLVCRKYDKGKKIKEFPEKDRAKARESREIKRKLNQNFHNNRGRSHHDKRNRSYPNHYEQRDRKF